MNNWTGLIVAVLGVLALSCTVRSGVDSAKGTQAPPPATGSSEIVTAAADSVDSSSATNPDYVFRMPVRQSLIPDPIHAKASESFMLLAEIFSGLTRLVDDTGVNSVDQDLAVSIQTADDGLRFTFALKPGIKYSDGSSVLASHFKWSWTRALSKGTSPRVSEILVVISGANDVVAGRTEDLAGVEVVDERTLVVALESPRSDFLMRLADPVAVMLNPDNVERWQTDFGAAWSGYDPSHPPFDFRELPVGTGPFALAEFDYLAGDCEIVRNANFIGDAPFLDRVQFVSDIPEPVTTESLDGIEFVDPSSEIGILWNAAINQHIHVFESFVDPSLSVNPRFLAEWRIDNSPTSFSSRFMVFNLDVPPFDDLNFRRALVASYPVATIPIAVGEPMPNGLVPATFLIQDEGDAPPMWSPSLGQRVLSDSKYPDVNDIEMHVNQSVGATNAIWGPVLTSWQSYLGISVKPVEISDTAYERAIESGSIGLIPVTASPRFPDRLLVLSVFADRIGNHSNSRASDSVKRKVAEAVAELDPVRRETLMAEVEATVAELAIALPFRWDYNTRFIVTPKKVRGYEVPLFHRSRFKEVKFAD